MGFGQGAACQFYPIIRNKYFSIGELSFLKSGGCESILLFSRIVLLRAELSLFRLNLFLVRHFFILVFTFRMPECR